jgi:hypothetical protein
MILAGALASFASGSLFGCSLAQPADVGDVTCLRSALRFVFRFDGDITSLAGWFVRLNDEADSAAREVAAFELDRLFRVDAFHLVVVQVARFEHQSVDVCTTTFEMVRQAC